MVAYKGVTGDTYGYYTHISRTSTAHRKSRYLLCSHLHVCQEVARQAVLPLPTYFIPSVPNRLVSSQLGEEQDGGVVDSDVQNYAAARQLAPLKETGAERKSGKSTRNLGSPKIFFGGGGALREQLDETERSGVGSTSSIAEGCTYLHVLLMRFEPSGFVLPHVFV